ncbi:hypothetical protein RSAG8_07037, partial [Rhizoctonia solani AG-8 WAC10335]
MYLIRIPADGCRSLERVCDDPWKIIVATTLLNKTNGKAAAPVFWELIKRWPTPTALAQASAPNMTELLRPLGTQFVRTSRLIPLWQKRALSDSALKTLWNST